ncbi:hypothetical protein DVH24_042554 [Malus domestica]|uniref:Uncharacterized protein n=1 Tax=Malus domestica TaxID=3750 RepID=A0A498JBC4_MALDO|nr:hypothetical protein DVH24_042554 [Malus domestica]
MKQGLGGKNCSDEAAGVGSPVGGGGSIKVEEDVAGFVVKAEEATGEREGRREGRRVNSGINEKEEGVERVVPGGKVERKSNQIWFHGTAHCTVFGASNVRRNASSHCILSRPTYQTVPW